MDGITFFGSVDRDKKTGNIGSECPAWAMDVHTNELKESIASQERSLERGNLPTDSIPLIRASITKEKKRLEEIESSKPKLSDVVIDKVAKAYNEIGKGISETMFSKDEMKSKSADPREEVRRMINPCVKVSPEIADMCGVKTDSSGMVSRNDASKIYKICGKYLGENSNVENLRKESRRGR